MWWETYECEEFAADVPAVNLFILHSGVENVDYWTHRDALDNKVPASLTIVGGGGSVWNLLLSLPVWEYR